MFRLHSSLDKYEKKCHVHSRHDRISVVCIIAVPTIQTENSVQSTPSKGRDYSKNIGWTYNDYGRKEAFQPIKVPV